MRRVSDPRNLGAVIPVPPRPPGPWSGDPKRRSAGLTAIVAKTSAGAVSYLPVARVANLTALLKELKEQGLWIFGTAADGTTSLYQADLKGPRPLSLEVKGAAWAGWFENSATF